MRLAVAKIWQGTAIHTRFEEASSIIVDRPTKYAFGIRVAIQMNYQPDFR